MWTLCEPCPCLTTVESSVTALAGPFLGGVQKVRLPYRVVDRARSCVYHDPVASPGAIETHSGYRDTTPREIHARYSMSRFEENAHPAGLQCKGIQDVLGRLMAAVPRVRPEFASYMTPGDMHVHAVFEAVISSCLTLPWPRFELTKDDHSLPWRHGAGDRVFQTMANAPNKKHLPSTVRRHFYRGQHDR